MRTIKKVVYLCVRICLFLTVPLHAAGVAKRASWTVMVYAQTDSILNNFVLQNFNAMASVGSNDRLNIITQWNRPRRDGTWRYKIEKNKMRLINSGDTKKTLNLQDDLIDFAAFAVKHYPADNYAFILSSHGIGILDPSWKDLRHYSINPANLGRDIQTKLAPHQRGILFDIPNKTYLKNDGLTNAFAHMTKHILKKKFALIGMDACLMAMFEVFFQLRHFADYLVASEEIELARGWHYTPFLYNLAHAQTTTPSDVVAKSLASDIVFSFESFYKNKTKFYTQSAIDLEGIEFVKQNIDQLVANLLLCKQLAPKEIGAAIKNARKHCFQLSIPCYVDLHSFYAELYKQLTTIEARAAIKPWQQKQVNISSRRNKTTNQARLQALINSRQFADAKEALVIGTKIQESTIIANVSSTYLSRARGISIYFPTLNCPTHPAVTRSNKNPMSVIDPSYLATEFAQESLWLPFLEENIS